GRGFIEEKKTRLGGEGAAELDDLAHAVRETGHENVAVFPELQEIDHLLDLPPVGELLAADEGREECLLEKPAPVVAVAAEHQVIEHGRVVEEVDVLEGARDAG